MPVNDNGTFWRFCLEEMTIQTVYSVQRTFYKINYTNQIIQRLIHDILRPANRGYGHY